jgi:xanthine dehydrogenase/oxidase
MVAVLENVRWFAGTQIRNVATIAGNIVTASPISDMNPVLVALGAILKVSSRSQGERYIPMDVFFLGYRKTALKPDEVVISVNIPFCRAGEFAFAFKQAKRRDDDIAIVTCGLRVKLSSGNNGEFVVEEFSGGYGGMGPTTFRFVPDFTMINYHVIFLA